MEEETFVRLNTGLFAKICLDRKQYEAYYKVFENVLKKFFSSKDMIVVSQILQLCRERNYFMRYLNGDKKRTLLLKFLPSTIESLIESGFVTQGQIDEKSSALKLSIDPVVANICEKFIDSHPSMTLLDLTQILMLQTGKFLMKPVLSNSKDDLTSHLKSKISKGDDWDKSIESWLVS